MNLTSCVLLTACLLPALAAAAPVELFVAPGGSDAAAGTSAQTALQSLAAARDKARALNAADGVVVQVAPGVYSLPATLAFGAEDRRVTFRGQRDDKPQILGGRVLTGFEPHRDGIMKLDLAKAGLKGVGFGQLFFNGQRMTLARTPNAAPDDIHGGVWAHVVEPSPRPSARSFAYDKREIEPRGWAHPEDGRIGIFCRYDWRWNRIPLAGANLDLGTLTLTRDATYELETGDRYFIEGIFEELDQPGEWYLDRRTDTLYFLPPGDLATGQVSYAGIDQLITISGSTGVRFEQFIIEGSAGTAVEIQDAVDCAIVGCEIRNTGAWAVGIDGGQRDAVLGCDIHDTGYGGVRVNGGDRASLTGAGHRVDNNYIHHIAVFEKTYNTAINLSGVGNQATHNLIHDTPHAALTLAGNDNLVEFNVIHHTNLQSTDTGGIYSCPRDWTQRGNIIRYNRWSDIGGFGKKSSWTPVSDGKVDFEYPHFTWAIYMDDPTSGNLIYGNVLYRVPVSGLHNHGGRDNVWENNVIVDCPAFQAGMLAEDWGEWPKVFEKFLAVCQPGSVYFDRYPALKEYGDEHPEAMTGLKFERNIVYYTVEGTRWLREHRGWGTKQKLYTYRLRDADFGANSFDHNLIGADPSLSLEIDLTRRPEPSQTLSWEQWQATGMDRNSVLADPKFVDPANHDYRLQPDSPALKLGFKPIPIEQMGLYGSPDRASWPVQEAPGAAGVAQPLVRSFQLPGFEPLAAQPLYARGGLANTFGKLKARQTVRVAYYGGGIHPANGWRKGLVDWLRQQYPEATIELINGEITDAVRGSGFSVYRYRHDVLQHKPDLVLVDYTSDDHVTNSLSIQRAIEGIVRQTWRDRPLTDILFLHAFRAGFESAYAEGLTPPAVSAYEHLAEHYGIPSINMGLGGLKLFTSGAWKDGTRPTREVDAAYTQVIGEGLEALRGLGTPGPHPLRPPLRQDNLEGAGLMPITRAMLTGEWVELPADDPNRQAQARHFDTIWHTTSPGAKLTVTFTGTHLSLFHLIGPDTGRVRVTVDGKDAGIRQSVDPWCYYQRLAGADLATGLPMGEHTVIIELLPDAPDRSKPIEEAKRLNVYKPADFEGVALRIGALRVIGAP